ALYHHFQSKQELALAVVREILGGHVQGFVSELAQAPDPIRALREWVEGPSWVDERMGCPLNNLAQEMATLDESFRRGIEAVFQAWRDGIAEALRHGQKARWVRRDADPVAAAGFILATLEGSISLAKSAKDQRIFRSNMKLLAEFIQ